MDPSLKIVVDDSSVYKSDDEQSVYKSDDEQSEYKSDDEQSVYKSDDEQSVYKSDALQEDVNFIVERDPFTEEIKCRSMVVAAFINNMILKGNALIKQFDDREHNLSELITKRFDDLVAVVEKRKKELLSELKEKTLSTTTAINLDIEQCEKYLTTIQSQSNMLDNSKNSKFSKFDNKFLHNVLKSIDSNLSEIQSATVELFQVNNIHVDLDYKPPDNIIRDHGRISQPSPRHSECSVAFIRNHYKIILTTKTIEDELYPYGGLSASAYFSNSVSQDSKDVKAATEVKDNRDGTYLIKLPYDSKYKDSSIIVTLNDQIVAELTELYAMIDQIDTINAIPPKRTITDGGDILYIIGNYSSSNDIDLVHINQNNIYCVYSKVHSDIYSSTNRVIYTHHDHITMPVYYGYNCTNVINLYNLNGTLIKQYKPDVCPDMRDFSQAIFIQCGSMKNIVFVNSSPNDGNFSVSDCKIGILNCEDGKIKVKISSQMVALIDVKIIVGDEFIYVTGRNKDQTRKKFKLFDITGKLVGEISFEYEIHGLDIKNDIVIVATDRHIIMYNKSLTTVKSEEVVKYKYDIIRYDNNKIYAISNLEKMLSIWNVPKCIK